ncbi:hypothetical protein INT47_007485 [Mucor saturninus]|uniref:Heat shock protein 70 n=1 Tax=Mucor saturninus TaxID=64648 RepID=A0A8H7V3A3_9FUNG|nr:hypothetical protein INT47_007485 [Mucor saturninus]
MFKDEYDFVVGIDFGTTYSGCCYCVVNDDEPNVQIIKNWPRQSALITTLPTIVTYSKNDHKPIGIGNVPETPLSYPVKELPHLLCFNYSLSISHIDTVADFLRILCDHIVKRIKLDSHNPNLKPRIRYCFTLQHPSKPNYKKNLFAAIGKAGIYTENDRDDKIVFLDSYTAMAKYFLKTRKGLNLKDKFIVCDTDDYYLRIKTMLVISNGRDKDVMEHEPEKNITNYELGGNNIDKCFSEYITKIIKEHPDHEEVAAEDLDNVIEIIVQNFIKNIKYKDFGSKKEIYIAKPSIQSFAKSKNPYLTIITDDLKANVYDKVINEICSNVSNVCEKQKPKAFFLFGKLSNSEYLYEKLSDIVDDIIVIPEKDLSAAQGLVYHGRSEPLTIQRITPIYHGDAVVKDEDRSYYDFDYSHYTHVIGIDFGTSFSKWYYEATLPGDPVIFDKTIMQIPTLSLYDQRLHEQKLWGTEAYRNYYSSENSGKLLTRFKLFLNELNYEGFDELTAINAIASYLKALHENILQTMAKKYGKEDTVFRYCLTVPTIWSDKTKKSMRDAAVLAGIIKTHDHPCRLMLVNEPEAAAMFYTKDPYFVEKFPKKKIIRALVCDAGGGTVDMATYEMIKDNTGNDYSINEKTPGSGGICGASFLDDNFRVLIKKKCYDLDIRVSDHGMEQMVNQFAVDIKDRFLATDSKNIEIFIPPGDKLDIYPRLEVTPNELSAQVFEPVTEKVLELIRNQHKLSNPAPINPDNPEALDVIILTGGLGQSKYLQKKVQDYYKDIIVYSPFMYDQSVVRGAVAIALNPNIITHRITRRSYGIEVLLPFNSVTDPAMNKIKTKNGDEYTKFKYDNFVIKSTSIKTYEYYEKQLYVEYPNNTYAAIYASDYDDEHKIYNVRDSRAEQVFKFNIEMPNDKNKKEGDLVPLIIRMFLGQTEIKVDTIFEGQTKRQSFYFNALDENHRTRIESRHAKRYVSTPTATPISVPAPAPKTPEAPRKLKPE